MNIRPITLEELFAEYNNAKKTYYDYQTEVYPPSDIVLGSLKRIIDEHRNELIDRLRKDLP